MEHKTFAKCMAALAEIFDRKMSTKLLDIYWGIFREYSDEEFQTAVFEAAKTLRFFPKPADLLEILDGSQDDQIELAWESLETAIRQIGAWDSVAFEDEALSAAVETLGGWTKVCGWTEAEMPFRRKEFERVYRIHMQRKSRGPSWHPGWIEIRNRARGFLENIPPPRVIEKPRSGIAGMIEAAGLKQIEAGS